MVRTQIQLPDEVFKRARRMCRTREISFAELARRGIEELLTQYSETAVVKEAWTLPSLEGVEVKVSLESLKDISCDDATDRGLPARK
jgi:hypothetical protein